MSEILSQAEIEALLSSLGGGEPEAPAAAVEPTPAKAPTGGGNPFTFLAAASRPGAKSAVAYEVYDFRRPDKFSKEQLRTLQMLHETFARMAGSTLSASLRSAVSIELISLEQVPYEEYLRSINQSVFTILSLPPLSGQAVLEIEFGLVFSIIDRMLGGPGKSLNRSVLTDIERPLVRHMIERIFQSLKAAWEGVVIVNPGIEGMETSSQFVQIAPPSDIVVTMLFEVKIGQQRSAMSLCIPYLVLKPITTKLSAQKWFANSGKKHSATHKRQLTYQVNNSVVKCTVRLGRSRILMRDYLALQEGDILRLDQRTRDDLFFLVDNVAKYRGRPAMDGRRVVFTVTNAIKD